MHGIINIHIYIETKETDDTNYVQSSLKSRPLWINLYLWNLMTFDILNGLYRHNFSDDFELWTVNNLYLIKHDISIIFFFKVYYFKLWFLYISLSLRLEKQQRIPYFVSDKGLKGTAVNRAWPPFNGNCNDSFF